jgi:hypothetical protein
VHYGLTDAILEARAQTLQAAFLAIRNASKAACLCLTPCPRPSGSINLTTRQRTSWINRGRKKSFYSNFSKKVSQNH